MRYLLQRAEAPVELTMRPTCMPQHIYFFAEIPWLHFPAMLVSHDPHLSQSKNRCSWVSGLACSGQAVRPFVGCGWHSVTDIY